MIEELEGDLYSLIAVADNKIGASIYYLSSVLYRKYHPKNDADATLFDFRCRCDSIIETMEYDDVITQAGNNPRSYTAFGVQDL